MTTHNSHIIHNTRHANNANLANGTGNTAPAIPSQTAGVSSAVRAFLGRRLRALSGQEDGMSTVEYALGTIAAAAFGALLYTVVTGGEISDSLTNIIERALNTNV